MFIDMVIKPAQQRIAWRVQTACRNALGWDVD